MSSKCRFCNKDFESDSGLLMHFNDKHKPEKGNLGINEIKKSGISARAIILAAAIACCGIPVVLIGLSSLGIFGFFAPHTSSVQSAYGIANVAIGEVAPNIPITLTNGTNITLSSLRGRPVVLWFVTTWCPSCQESESILANNGYYNEIHAKGARFVTIELYDDLGEPGPSLSDFSSKYGEGYTQNKTWLLYGTSNLNATYSYDPKEYLEIYYVINSNGVIINTSSTGLVNNIGSVIQEA